MVQTHLTVHASGHQRQDCGWRLRWQSRRSRCGWPVAQGDEPIRGCICHAAHLERTLPLMHPTSEDAMIVPDGQQGQQTRRQGPMHGQMGAQDAVPVLDRTAGTGCCKLQFQRYRLPHPRRWRSSRSCSLPKGFRMPKPPIPYADESIGNTPSRSS